MYSFLKFKVKPSGTPATEEVTLKRENETAAQTSVVMVEKGGIGLVDPGQAVDLYESMHSYLAKAGITGVKVDVIHALLSRLLILLLEFQVKVMAQLAKIVRC